MNLSISIATPDDGAAIVEIKNEAAQQLTSLYGKGHWSYQCTEKGVRSGMTGKSKVFIAKIENEIVGTLRLTTKKPWAIDIAYFTKVDQPLYLVDMAVHPRWQRMRIGRQLLEEIKPFVATPNVRGPAQAIRLDAYDNDAGAGEFYRKCGYTEKGRIIYKKNPLIYFECLI